MAVTLPGWHDCAHAYGDGHTTMLVQRMSSPRWFEPFSFSLTKYSSTLLTDEESFLRNWNVPAFSSYNRDEKFYLLPRKIFLPLLIIQPMAASIFSRFNEGLTLESYFWLSLHGGNLTFVNLFDTKSSCFTSRSPPTWHHSFIRN